jgi:hypothetical protein
MRAAQWFCSLGGWTLSMRAGERRPFHCRGGCPQSSDSPFSWEAIEGGSGSQSATLLGLRRFESARKALPVDSTAARFTWPELNFSDSCRFKTQTTSSPPPANELNTSRRLASRVLECANFDSSDDRLHRSALRRPSKQSERRQSATPTGPLVNGSNQHDLRHGWGLLWRRRLLFRPAASPILRITHRAAKFAVSRLLVNIDDGTLPCSDAADARYASFCVALLLLANFASARWRPQRSPFIIKFLQDLFHMPGLPSINERPGR